jgi:phosphatidylglycerophosphate synthase
MARRVAVITVLLVAVIVGALTAWQWGVLILFGAIFLSGIGYLAGVEIDATQRWGRAHAGDDPDDEGHWSRR